MPRRVTNDEDEIRAWAARNGARPVQKALYVQDTEPAQLDFVFGEASGSEEDLHPIEWATFFAMFHMLGLVLAYDESREFQLLKTEGRKAGRFEGKPLMS